MIKLFREILSYFRYTRKGRRLYSQCGAIIILGNPPWTQAQRGVEFNETGIAIRRFQLRYFLEVNERLQDNAGQTIARAVSDKASKEVTLEGEETGPGTGLFAFALGTVVSGSQGIHNDTTEFPGSTSGSMIFDEATVTQERAGWRTLSARLSSNPYL